MNPLYAAADAIDKLREQLETTKDKLYAAAWVVPPPGATTFEVTDDDVALALGAVREVSFGDLEVAVRTALRVYAYELAQRAALGGPEVTDADVVETQALIHAFHESGRPMMRALLEHDRARVAARTADAEGEVPA